MQTFPPLTLRPLVLAGLLALGACATPAPRPLRTVTDIDADAGVVDLVRGQDLEIALPLNAGTGHAWRLDREAPPLLAGGSSFVTDAKAPGAPVRAVYRYTAAGRGRTTIHAPAPRRSTSGLSPTSSSTSVTRSRIAERERSV